MYGTTILWLGWHHSSSGTCFPHNFYTEIWKAWCVMVRHGVVPTKLKNRHLTLKQDLHRPLVTVTISPLPLFDMPAQYNNRPGCNSSYDYRTKLIIIIIVFWTTLNLLYRTGWDMLISRGRPKMALELDNCGVKNNPSHTSLVLIWFWVYPGSGNSWTSDEIRNKNSFLNYWVLQTVWGHFICIYPNITQIFQELRFSIRFHLGST